MARSTLVAALLLAGLAVGATACDTSPAGPLPAPVSVPSVPGGAPLPPDEQDDDGYVAPPPAGVQEDGDDGADDGADDGPDGADDDG
ncbi:MAG TPA: hypothetical protein VK935_02525 [Actinomycetospora sp.]|nr:hypothetical protein [Actinomycetospora sp.]